MYPEVPSGSVTPHSYCSFFLYQDTTKKTSRRVNNNKLFSYNDVDDGAFYPPHPFTPFIHPLTVFQRERERLFQILIVSRDTLVSVLFCSRRVCLQWLVLCNTIFLYVISLRERAHTCSTDTVKGKFVTQGWSVAVWYCRTSLSTTTLWYNVCIWIHCITVLFRVSSDCLSCWRFTSSVFDDLWL